MKIHFNIKKSHKDVYDHLQLQENVSSYLCRLVRQDKHNAQKNYDMQVAMNRKIDELKASIDKLKVQGIVVVTELAEPNFVESNNTVEFASENSLAMMDDMDDFG